MAYHNCLSETGLLEYEDYSMYETASAVIKQEPCLDTFLDTTDQPTYTDLSSCSLSPKISILKQEQTDMSDCFDSLLSWTEKHPEHWSAREVLDWVYYVADAKSFDGSKVCGEAYQSLAGQQLCRMTRDDFIRRDMHYGATMYDLFRSLVAKSVFCEPASPDSMNPDAYPFLDTTFPCLPVPISAPRETRTASEDLSMVLRDGGVAVHLDGHVYDIDIGTKIELPDQKDADCGYVSGGSDMDHDSYQVDRPRSSSTSSDMYDTLSNSDLDELPPFTYFQHSVPRKRATPSESSEEELEGQQTTRRRINSTSKGNHLWEFVRDLLKDPKFNPSLLKWEDKEAGVFKFVQSEAVANMWGRKKNNPGMTYEKLSRAMRFCRTAGYFGEVPKNGKFPKKLCFRFGPKAHDWK